MLCIDGEMQQFKGTVTIISADNPASACLGGFKQSATAFRYCRHCMGTQDDIQTKVGLYLFIVLMYNTLETVCRRPVYPSLRLFPFRALQHVRKR